jgi:hypothetical protein
LGVPGCEHDVCSFQSIPPRPDKCSTPGSWLDPLPPNVGNKPDTRPGRWQPTQSPARSASIRPRSLSGRATSLAIPGVGGEPALGQYGEAALARAAQATQQARSYAWTGVRTKIGIFLVVFVWYSA